MLSHIINHLAKKKEIYGWQIKETKKSSFQSFLALKEKECQRQVRATLYKVTIHLKKGDILGIASFQISPSEFEIFENKLEEALFSASLTKNQIFELPPQPAELPPVEISDSSISEQTLKPCENRLRDAVQKEKDVRLSAAEFFADRIHSRLVNHQGLDLEQEETFLQTEFILLAKSDGMEKEFITRYKRRFLTDFDLEGEIKNSARYAREATQATLPQTGRFPVLISEEPLDNLFNPLIAKASARLKFNKMIQGEKGKTVLEDGQAEGDKITLWSNGTLKRMGGSNRFDTYGTPGQRVCLIDKNVLKNFLADKRYGDYLKETPTGDLGNAEIDGGSTPFKQLRDKPGGEILYHLTSFSAFEPNPISGAFSAEIRSGYEISKKGVRPIKGGSVSGILQKDLRHCTLSKEQVARERYFGPKGILFHSLSIAGKNS